MDPFNVSRRAATAIDADELDAMAQYLVRRGWRSLVAHDVEQYRFANPSRDARLVIFKPKARPGLAPVKINSVGVLVAQTAHVVAEGPECRAAIGMVCAAVESRAHMHESAAEVCAKGRV